MSADLDKEQRVNVSDLIYQDLFPVCDIVGAGFGPSEPGPCGGSR